MRKLTPDLYVKSVFDVDIEQLKARGIKAIIADLDNTLVAWDDPLPNEPLATWLKEVQGHGLEVYIVSNNSPERVDKFAQALGVPAISKAIKPRRGAFRAACKELGVEPSQAAVIGDQIFTDILGGNRLGLYTVLVVPVSNREFIGTKVVRQIERVVLRFLKARGLTDSPDAGE